MPSHQDRRAPLPADYQYPTHGVDCDCPPCRNQVVETRFRLGVDICAVCGTTGRYDCPGCGIPGWWTRRDKHSADTPWGV